MMKAAKIEVHISFCFAAAAATAAVVFVSLITQLIWISFEE